MITGYSMTFNLNPHFIGEETVSERGSDSVKAKPLVSYYFLKRQKIVFLFQRQI